MIDQGVPVPVAVTVTVPVIVVIGMHRSGTSMCANMLQRLGADMAEDGYVAPGNAKGHWERQYLVNMNDAILAQLGRSWLSPAHVLDLPAQWLADRRIQELRRNAAAWLAPLLRSDSIVGLKDPRTTLLLPFWQQVLGDVGAAPRYVFCVRSPAQVARSLQARDGMEPGHAEYRWLAYNVEAIAAVADGPVCTVPYEAWFDSPLGMARRLARHAGLPAPAPARIQAVIDADLRHDTVEASAPLALAGTLHEAIMGAAAKSCFPARLRDLAGQIRHFRAQVQPLLTDMVMARVGMNEQHRVIGELQALIRRLRQEAKA